MQSGPFTDMSAMESGIILLPIQWTSGGTGAVPALSAFRYHQHVVSVTRNSAGSYTIVFNEGVVGIIGLMSGGVVQATPATGGLTAKMTVGASSTVPLSITVVVTIPDGTATDPASGDVVMLCLAVQYVDVIGNN